MEWAELSRSGIAAKGQCVQYCLLIAIYVTRKSAYGGLLSSCCGGLQPSAAPQVPFRQTGGRTDGRTTGLRELEGKENLLSTS